MSWSSVPAGASPLRALVGTQEFVLHKTTPTSAVARAVGMHKDFSGLYWAIPGGGPHTWATTRELAVHAHQHGLEFRVMDFGSGKTGALPVGRV